MIMILAEICPSKAVKIVAMSNHLWQFMLVTLAGWLNRQQQIVIEYLMEENRVLRELHGKKRLRFTDNDHETGCPSFSDCCQVDSRRRSASGEVGAAPSF